MSGKIKEIIPVFDGHNDTIMLMIDEPRPMNQESDQGHFDLPRAEKGGFTGGMFAVFIPRELGKFKELMGTTLPGKNDPQLKPIDSVYAQEVTRQAISIFHEMTKKSNGKLQQVTTTSQIRKNMNCGVVSCVLHFEGAEAINENLSNLDAFYDLGLRSIGPVWSRANVFGHGVDFIFPGSPDSGPGLTKAGKELVKACNQKGIVIDLSHLNEKGFWDVEKTTQHPLVATHSCMHTLCHMPRNLTDRQLDAVKASNGVVGINFCPAFLREDGKLTKKTPISQLIRHIRYGVDRMGVDHVALGSDFNGVLLPEEIRDVAGLQAIIQALFQDGFDRKTVLKIAHGNWLRILGETWR